MSNHATARDAREDRVSDARPSVLVVEGQTLVRRGFQRQFHQQGFDVEAAATGARALELAGGRSFDLALVSTDLDDIDGPTLVRRLRVVSPETAVIAITAEGQAEDAFRVLKEGARDYFEVPISDIERFYRVVRSNVELARHAAEVRALRARMARLEEIRQNGSMAELIGNSPAMEQLKANIARVGAAGIEVLVTGPSGSGKELVARALHAQGAHRNGPFVAVNCAAIPSTLLESELFGAERGAFTDARQTKLGLFEVAEGGTVFLDEIGDMPYDTQAKLLRVLQVREFMRIGGTRPIKLRARVVSATHQDLRQRVAEGRFRQDLLFRINAVEIRVPPLAERKEDIPLLAWYFLQKYNREFDRDIRRIAPDAMRHLTSLDYTENNVRELENLIRRAVALSFEGDEITLADLDPSPSPATSAPVPAAIPSEPEWLDLPYKEAKARVVTEFTRNYIVARLEEANYNITRAAELAGMLRPNFSALMRRHGIRVQNHRIVKA